jgi:hypothetical protein
MGMCCNFCAHAQAVGLKIMIVLRCETTYIVAPVRPTEVGCSTLTDGSRFCLAEPAAGQSYVFRLVRFLMLFLSVGRHSFSGLNNFFKKKNLNHLKNCIVNVIKDTQSNFIPLNHIYKIFVAGRSI